MTHHERPELVQIWTSHGFGPCILVPLCSVRSQSRCFLLVSLDLGIVTADRVVVNTNSRFRPSLGTGPRSWMLDRKITQNILTQLVNSTNADRGSIIVGKIIPREIFRLAMQPLPHGESTGADFWVRCIAPTASHSPPPSYTTFVPPLFPFSPRIVYLFRLAIPSHPLIPFSLRCDTTISFKKALLQCTTDHFLFLHS